MLKTTDERTNYLIKFGDKAMDQRSIPKTIYSFVHSLGLVKYHCNACYIHFCQITILTQTHRSELVQCVSTQDRTTLPPFLYSLPFSSPFSRLQWIGTYLGHGKMNIWQNINAHTTEAILGLSMFPVYLEHYRMFFI